MRVGKPPFKRAGVPNLLFHDLRRSATRNMRKAGIDQSVRMKISGHRTDSMERRYDIMDTARYQGCWKETGRFPKGTEEEAYGKRRETDRP